jgi:hypothetical protein
MFVTFSHNVVESSMLSSRWQRADFQCGAVNVLFRASVALLARGEPERSGNRAESSLFILPFGSVGQKRQDKPANNGGNSLIPMSTRAYPPGSGVVLSQTPMQFGLIRDGLDVRALQGPENLNAEVGPHGISTY